MKLFRHRANEPASRPPGAPADIDLAERLRDVTADVSKRPAGAPAAGGPAGTPDQPTLAAQDGVPSPSPAPGAPGLHGSDPAVVPPPDPYVDRLTNLLGPEVFERLLLAESARSRRYGRPAALVIAELAGLEELTRSWGVEVGTQAVVALAEVLRRGSRTSDYVGRIATDRFAIILTETDEIAAINYVERVREAWERMPAIVGGALAVGFGWAGTPGRETLLDARPTAEELLRRDLRTRPPA